MSAKETKKKDQKFLHSGKIKHSPLTMCGSHFQIEDQQYYFTQFKKPSVIKWPLASPPSTAGNNSG